MNTSQTELRDALAQNVTVTDDALMVDLADGRTITVPPGWFPRLAHGETNERANWRLIGGGEGIHWPELDEDISIAGSSRDASQESLRKLFDSGSKGERRVDATRRLPLQKHLPADRVPIRLGITRRNVRHRHAAIRQGRRGAFLR